MSDLLDSTVKKKTVHDGFTNIQDRIRHAFIDGLIIILISASIRSLVDLGQFISTYETLKFVSVIIIFAVYAIYHTLLEYYVGFTIGKWLNKTRVVNLDEGKPTFIQILIRTVARIIPFGFITIPTPYQAALHDLLSKTRTVRIKKKKVVEVNQF